MKGGNAGKLSAKNFFGIKYYINFCLSSKIYVMGSDEKNILFHTHCTYVALHNAK